MKVKGDRFAIFCEKPETAFFWIYLHPKTMSRFIFHGNAVPIQQLMLVIAKSMMLEKHCLRQSEKILTDMKLD